MESAVDIALPKREELGEVGEPGSDIQILPDVTLQEVLVIGHPVENFRSGDPVIGELCDEGLIDAVRHQSLLAILYLS